MFYHPKGLAGVVPSKGDQVYGVIHTLDGCDYDPFDE